MPSLPYQNRRVLDSASVARKNEGKQTLARYSGTLTSRYRLLANLSARSVARVIEAHFDNAYYLAQCVDGEVISHPALHYVKVGAALGLDPCEEFSTNYYVKRNVDVARDGVNPFWHYIKYGKAEDRVALPPVQKAEAPLSSETAGDFFTELFDPEFYRRSYSDLPEDDADLFQHYDSIGWLLGYDPNDWFSTRGYLLANSDVALARENPFVHYLLRGSDENRPLDVPSEELSKDRLAEINQTMDRIRENFDKKYYNATYLDVAEAGVDPLFHYCAEGFRESRDPNAEFCTAYYLESNPDVEDAGVNPFLHYIEVGKSEGRFPKHPGGKKFETLTKFNSLEQLVEDWTRLTPLSDLLGFDALKSALVDVEHLGQIMISIGHDDYEVVPGGVQLCIQLDASIAAEQNTSHLSVFPWQPLPRLAHIDDTPDVAVCLRLNRQLIGVTRMSTLCDLASYFASREITANTVVHHLQGHNPEQIVKLILATGNAECQLWLHDFATLCPNPTLQRNTFEFCGCPKPESFACSVCLFGEERKSHGARMRSFFKTVDVHVVAPSVSARKLWSEAGDLKPASISVTPHAKLVWSRRETELSADEFGPVRIGYLGTPMAHKGWNEFIALAKEFAGDRFEFIYFGEQKVDQEGVIHIPTWVTAENETQMIDDVSRINIDFVLHWASWPETFSFTAFEAMAAGAFIITNKTSGNVAAASKKHRRGIVLEDSKALRSFLKDGEFEDHLARRREKHSLSHGRLSKSRMSFTSKESGKKQ